ncbi:hypothetical protein PG991_003387 [Apiospora marii]|uniref:Uncharacterized protein n=1 Tax=Apiospora marii TaxID=335849 RepID=A0ABR1S3H2_9PEZI
MLSSIRSQLAALMAPRTRSWFAVYLAVFVLLHNCSLLTRHYRHKARNLQLQARYHAVGILEELHFSVNILLTYYHYVNQGHLRFGLGSLSNRSIAKLGLDDMQTEFLEKSARAIKETRKLQPVSQKAIKRGAILMYRSGPRMRRARQECIFHDDYYFIAQMYQPDWEPPDQTITSVQFSEHEQQV